MGTVTKALELLGYFSGKRPEIALSEFARLSSRDKATVHRHLVELEENGFLEKNPISRTYRLGPAILRLTAVREATHPIRTVFRPIVDHLARQIGELCHASLLQGKVLSPVFHADPQLHGTHVHFEEGEILPLHATSSGLAVLAFASDDLVEDVLSKPLKAYTERTCTDRNDLRILLAGVKRDGMCRLDQAFDSEVSSIGGPIFGPDGYPIGAMAVAVPTVRVSPEKMSDVRSALSDAIRQATSSIGGAVPRGFPTRTDAPANSNKSPLPSEV
jgi:DNA-binding IclR family transcriptional regulator